MNRQFLSAFLLLTLMSMPLGKSFSAQNDQSVQQTPQEAQFSYFLNLIHSDDRSQVFLVDEDNGSTIEVHVGQRISIMLNYPRVDTQEEINWPFTEKLAAWKTYASADYFDTLFADADHPDADQKYVGWPLSRESYPERNMNRLTDADLDIKTFLGNTYTRMATYHALLAKRVTAPTETQNVILCCYKNQNILKKVTFRFKILPAVTTPSTPSPTPADPSIDPNAPETPPQ